MWIDKCIFSIVKKHLMSSKKFLHILLLLFLSSFLVQCLSLKKSPVSVRFLNNQLFAHDYKIGNLKLGGLSGLHFDKKSQTLYALSDDKKNHRFYKFSVTKKFGSYRLKPESQVLLHTLKSQSLDFNMDPEAITIIDRRNVYIASEGQQIFEKPDPPQIFRFDLRGRFLKSWKTPEVFWDTKRMAVFGAQENSSFESLSYDKESRSLWSATQKPLRQDLKNSQFPKTLLRMSQFKVSSGKLIEQYIYPLSSSKNGLTEIVYLKNKQFLTLEKVYLVKKKFNQVFLFFTDCRQATSLLKKRQDNITACSKTLIWSSKKQSDIGNLNLEGMTLMTTPDNQQILIMVNDNNFIKDKKTEFLFFKFKTSSSF